MENASKALIMAAEILIGVIIISIAVYLFGIFGSYSQEISKQMEDAKIAQFNSQFLQYTGERVNESNEKEPVKTTIHDLSSLANLAKMNNVENGLQKSDYNESGTTEYIRIDIGKVTNIEEYTEQKIIELIKTNTLDTTGKEIKYYKCTDYKVSEYTKKVYYLKFEEVK